MKLIDKVFKRTDWYVTSQFGTRKDPISGKVTTHRGTDYGTNRQEWKQYAIEDGIVNSVGKNTSCGNYVIILYQRLGIKLHHYHLSKTCVKKGQKVSEGTLIGYTGTTGYSTGIHLHLAVTDNNGNYINPHTYNYVEAKKEVIETPKTKSNEEIAKEVIAGKWGNGADRLHKLEAAGYDYKKVQSIINNILSSPKKPVNNRKTVDVVAQEVIRGAWGNGADRRNRLSKAGYDYGEVQAKVNKILRGGK